MPNYKIVETIQSKGETSLNVTKLIEDDERIKEKIGDKKFFANPKNKDYLQAMIEGIINNKAETIDELKKNGYVDFYFDDISFGDSLKQIEFGKRTELLIEVNGDYIVLRIFLGE